MAVVEFSIKDLESLVGRNLTREQLVDRLPMMGCPVEKIDRNRVSYEIFPNRPDMLSIEGFARAARSFLGLSTGLAPYKISGSGIKLKAERSVADIRPHVAAAVIRNVKLNDDIIASLMQVQEKLHDTLGRKRKKVAIGVHDLDRVKPPFTYKAVLPKAVRFVPLGKKERMTLDEIARGHEKGKEYAHIVSRSKRWPVIVDRNGDVLSFPPVINGELTRLTEKTRNLFIDVTGTSEEAVNYALAIIAASLGERGFRIECVDISGGKKRATPDMKPKRIRVNIDYVNKLLDLDMTKNEFAETIGRMGLGFDGKYVLFPAYRADIMHEIDVVEDVAIAHGYERFEPRVPKVATVAERSDMNEFSGFVRNIISGMGFQEVVSMILTNEADEFGKMLIRKEDACGTVNPVSSECTICRKRLLPSLLNVLSQNLHREYPQKIFEMNYVLLPDRNAETGARNVTKLACLISGSRAGYEDISSVLDSLLRQLGIGYKLRRSSNASMLEGRTADIIVGNKLLGTIGEIHPQVLNNWGLEKPAAGFELDLEEIFCLKKASR